KSVLDFAVEYHSLVSEEYEEEIEELKNTHFESDEYINAMLAKIFKRSNIIQKFKVIDGMPTMSAILTTHSIAQAKRIYHKIQALKAEGTLLNGKFLDETKQLNDPDFPRVAVTYSVSTPEGEQDRSKKIEADEELKQIMEQYNMQFGTTFDDVDRYNKNINERLARKSAQYKKDGNWLDLVIVVDRLLTGFDAPTIQTLFVDKELKYQGLLQAFSRTNRKHAGKDKGLIVTFRKPETMRKNVSDAMKLFSNEDREWENLIPKEYKAVKKELKEAFSSFVHAKNKIDNGSDDLKDQLQAIKTFNQLAKVTKAIKSYEDFGEELEELENITELTHKEAGNIENLKAEVKNKLEDLSENDDDLEKALEIEFSGDLKADFKEKIDSYYIYQLLKDNDREKLNKAIETKPAHIKEIYAQATAENIREQLQNKIDELLANFAKDIKAPINDIRISFNEYKGEEVPYINIIKEKSELTKEEVESFFKCKYRERLKAMESYFKTILDEKLMPIKEELK
ncbi:MAG: type I restriction endonuclease subunit R, partial [Defluviitaleaceae bacterium]|nr:type I restriction endonuclease subunit R [Defluviitaleaceae bacterium]